jgi:hypothetical protein
MGRKLERAEFARQGLVRPPLNIIGARCISESLIVFGRDEVQVSTIDLERVSACLSVTELRMVGGQEYITASHEGT